MELSPIRDEMHLIHDVTVLPASPEHVINPLWRDMLAAGTLAVHQVIVTAPRTATIRVFIADDPDEVADGGHLDYIENWLLHVGFVLRAPWRICDGEATARAIFEPVSQSPEWFHSFRHGMDHIASRSDDGRGAAIMYTHAYETADIDGCQHVELQRTDVFDADQHIAGASHVAIATDAELDAGGARALASVLLLAAERLEETTGGAQ